LKTLGIGGANKPKGKLRPEQKTICPNRRGQPDNVAWFIILRGIFQASDTKRWRNVTKLDSEPETSASA